MSNVVALPGVELMPSNGETDAHIVAMLEELLSRARSGHLRAFAYCTYDAAGMIGNGWIKGTEGFSLAAALMTLSHRFAGSTWLPEEGTDIFCGPTPPEPDHDGDQAG